MATTAVAAVIQHDDDDADDDSSTSLPYFRSNTTPAEIMGEVMPYLLCQGKCSPLWLSNASGSHTSCVQDILVMKGLAHSFELGMLVLQFAQKTLCNVTGGVLPPD